MSDVLIELDIRFVCCPHSLLAAHILSQSIASDKIPDIFFSGRMKLKRSAKISNDHGSTTKQLALKHGKCEEILSCTWNVKSMCVCTRSRVWGWGGGGNNHNDNIAPTYN